MMSRAIRSSRLMAQTIGGSRRDQDEVRSAHEPKHSPYVVSLIGPAEDSQPPQKTAINHVNLSLSKIEFQRKLNNAGIVAGGDDSPEHSRVVDSAFVLINATAGGNYSVQVTDWVCKIHVIQNIEHVAVKHQRFCQLTFTLGSLTTSPTCAQICHKRITRRSSEP